MRKKIDDADDFIRWQLLHQHTSSCSSSSVGLLRGGQWAWICVIVVGSNLIVQSSSFCTHGFGGEEPPSEYVIPQSIETFLGHEKRRIWLCQEAGQQITVFFRPTISFKTKRTAPLVSCDPTTQINGQCHSRTNDMWYRDYRPRESLPHTWFSLVIFSEWAYNLLRGKI